MRVKEAVAKPEGVVTSTDAIKDSCCGVGMPGVGGLQ